MKCKRRHLVFVPIHFLIIICFPFSVGAQIIGYDAGGKKTKSSGEEVVITIFKPSPDRGGAGTVSLPGVVGSLIGIGVDLVKTVVSNQEQKYTASYSSSTSETDLVAIPKSGDKSAAYLNIESVDFIRKVFDNSGREQIASKICLSAEPHRNSGMFRFKLDSLDLEISKAKILAKGRTGSMLDLSIKIKLDALWQEPINNNSSDTGKIHKAAPANISELTRSFQIKTATLGESIILVSAVSSGKVPVLGRDLYSGWFQLIPGSALEYADAENSFKVGQYLLTITVTEANPYGVRAKNLNSLLTASSQDINALIKQVFPILNK